MESTSMISPKGKGGPTKLLWIGKASGRELVLDQLKDDLSHYGFVERITILKNKNCLFVEYSSSEEAAIAMKQLAETAYFGREANVTFGEGYVPSSPLSHPGLHWDEAEEAHQQREEDETEKEEGIREDSEAVIESRLAYIKELKERYFSKWQRFAELKRNLKDILVAAEDNLRHKSLLKWFKLVFRLRPQPVDQVAQEKSLAPNLSSSASAEFPVRIRTRFVVLPGTKRKPYWPAEEATEEVLTIGGKCKEECYEIVEYPEKSVVECSRFASIPTAEFMGHFCSEELSLLYEGVKVPHVPPLYFLQDAALAFPPFPVRASQKSLPAEFLANRVSSQPLPEAASSSSTRILSKASPLGTITSAAGKKAPKPAEARPPAWEVVDRALVSKGREYNLFGTKLREPESKTKYFQCYNCGKLNSLPAVAPGTLFRCGVCRGLFDTTSTQKFDSKKNET